MAKKRSIKVYGQSGYKYQETPTIMLKGMWLKLAAAVALLRHGKVHKTASYAHYAQCRLLRNPSHTYIFFEYHKQDRFSDSGMI